MTFVLELHSSTRYQWGVQLPIQSREREYNSLPNTPSYLCTRSLSNSV